MDDKITKIKICPECKQDNIEDCIPLIREHLAEVGCGTLFADDCAAMAKEKITQLESDLACTKAELEQARELLRQLLTKCEEIRGGTTCISREEETLCLNCKIVTYQIKIQDTEPNAEGR